MCYIDILDRLFKNAHASKVGPDSAPLHALLWLFGDVVYSTPPLLNVCDSHFSCTLGLSKMHLLKNFCQYT